MEMPIDHLNQIKNLSNPLAVADHIALVKNSAKISVAAPKALAIFGLAGLAADTPLSNLAKIWSSAYPGSDAAWFENCCEQIVIAGAEKLPSIRPIAVKQVNGDAEYVPIVTKVRRISYQAVVRFDLYFLDLPARDGKSVASKMLTLYYSSSQ